MSLSKREKDTKIDPYEYCPCGSDKKFKFCCYQEARKNKKAVVPMSDYPDGRLQHEIKKRWDDTDFKICLGFDKENCRGEIKGAHTIQNNKILNRISDRGHVYTFDSDISRKGVQAKFKKISKNKASTFFGFCDYHDTEIFKPIEVEEYEGTNLQHYLFAFRGFCLEYHRKIRLMKTTRNVFRELPSLLLDPFTVNYYRKVQLDIEDFEKNYNELSNIYSKDDLEGLYTYAVKLDYEIEFAVCSSFAVERDLEGNTINDIYSTEPIDIPSVYVSIFPLEGCSLVLLSFQKNYKNIYLEYFKQIEKLGIEDLEKYLNFLVINYTENIFLSPGLLTRLDEGQKESLLKSFETSIKIDVKFDLLAKDKYFKFNLFRQE